MTARVSAAPPDAAALEPSGIATQAPVGQRPASSRGRMAGSRPSATRPASAPSTALGRRLGRVGVAAQSGQPAAPMAKSRLALNVAVLGLVFVAVAFVLAVPLRNYISQRNQLAASVAVEQQMTKDKQNLQQQKAALSDPAYLEYLAKQRLQLVEPGDTVYVVHAPALPKAATPRPAPAAAAAPWYSDLWNTLSDPVAPAGRAAAAPSTGKAGG